jgi:hypothetical protein
MSLAPYWTRQSLSVFVLANVPGLWELRKGSTTSMNEPNVQDAGMTIYNVSRPETPHSLGDSCFRNTG